MDSRINLGVDLDGVLAASFDRFIQIANQKHGMEVNKAAVTNHNVDEALDISRELVSEIFKDVWSDPSMIRIEDASIPKILNELRLKFRICIVTACIGSTEAVKQWLEDNEIEYDDFFHIRVDHNRQKKFEKDIEGIEIYLDDYDHVATDLAGKGNTVVLLKQNWNAAFGLKNANPKIIPAENWHEIKTVLINLHKAATEKKPIKN